MKVRNSAKAVIVRDDQLLAIRNESHGQIWYILPGGGQHHGESLTEAVRRECLEEASVDVIPGDILFIRDYISRNHEFFQEDGDAHQVEFMFRCTITGDGVPGNGTEPDSKQTGVEWLPLDRLDRYPLYPKQLRSILTNGIPKGHTVYLGDVN
jgi:8-oxo-dGTP diphosphatase